MADQKNTLTMSGAAPSSLPREALAMILSLGGEAIQLALKLGIDLVGWQISFKLPSGQVTSLIWSRDSEPPPTLPSPADAGPIKE